MNDEVKTLQGEGNEDILITDGDATLSLVRDVHMGHDGLFGFCMSDGGGFTGMIVTKENWESMKMKVDAFLDSEVKV
jgi:hypothetical protein